MKQNFSEGEDNILHDWERFELLSAYLDNQVTPTERKQVQDWLDTDPEFKKIYLQMLQLEQSLQTYTVVPAVSADVLCQKVFAKIDQQQRNRKIGLVFSLGVIAVLGFFHYSPKPSWELASAYRPSEGDSLTIALNHPIIQLPQP